MAQSNQALLAAGIKQLGLDVSEHQQAQLLDYVALLAKWNRAYNLTAVRNEPDMVIRHLLDSLAVLPFVEDVPLLDIGTGAGIPGIIFAICRPEQAFTLLDSNGKKTRFVRQAALELALDNVQVVQQRVEQYGGSFPQLCCRAFASLPDILQLCGHLLAPNGRVLAMKATDEDAKPTPGWQRQVHPLNVPYLQESRQLWVIEAADSGE